MSVKVAVPDTSFTQSTITVKDMTFTLKELTAGQYDDAVRAAETNAGEVDSVLLLRLMLLDSMIEPRMNAEELNALPYRVIRRLNQAVNELHWAADQDGDEPGND